MIDFAERNKRPTDSVFKWCVYEELADGSDVVIEWFRDEIQAGSLCGQLCDAWEQAYMPSEVMSDEDRQNWRDNNDWAPFYISEIDQYYVSRQPSALAAAVNSTSAS